MSESLDQEKFQQWINNTNLMVQQELEKNCNHTFIIPSSIDQEVLEILFLKTNGKYKTVFTPIEKNLTRVTIILK